MSSPDFKKKQKRKNEAIRQKETGGKEEVRIPRDADLVRLKGFEPPTFWFVAKHSIQLSYSRISAQAFISR